MGAYGGRDDAPPAITEAVVKAWSWYLFVIVIFFGMLYFAYRTQMKPWG